MQDPTDTLVVNPVGWEPECLWGADPGVLPPVIPRDLIDVYAFWGSTLCISQSLKAALTAGRAQMSRPLRLEATHDTLPVSSPAMFTIRSHIARPA
eukprot:CAMPEP_0169434856 /NCGR_PEP_ID=MMETSP1042-20121227/4753_1 /TAXON_ID=464988 /ORGANISM="Hemiselmis andersenii, Strain CCMP1180" /LENGTH=95 /DNA_ID=CAMNT_0009545461 /DNA_START=30 /DNA_END=314 /DNA_ORIENTATION=-